VHTIDINDFKWFEYYPQLANPNPEITISADEVIFNVATLKILGFPPSIMLMFDPNNRRFAIQGFMKKGSKTINFPPERKSRNFGIYKKDKVQFIRDMMPEWDEKTRFKVQGKYHKNENLVVYDLKTASIYSVEKK